MSSTTIVSLTTRTTAFKDSRTGSGHRRETLMRLSNIFAGAASGTRDASAVSIATSGAQASGTITLASCAAGTVVRVNGVPFTAVSGTPVVANGEFDISGNDTADATSLVAAINGSTDARISGIVSATSALGVVTVTATQAGYPGNAIPIVTDGIVASGTVTISSGSGSITATINGVALSTTWATSDTATAAALAAVINASSNALVSGFVRATSSAGVVTIRAIPVGKRGNAITLAASGTGATASVARLAGGTVASSTGAQASGTVTLDTGSGTITATINGVDVSITWATSDANSAALLAAAINSSTNALVRELVTASASSGVVTITAVHGGTSGNAITLAATGTGATASGARLTGGAAPTTVVLSGTALTGGSSDAVLSFSL